jgi:hypothetical protein
MGLKIDESHWLLGFPVPVFLDYSQVSNKVACLFINFQHFAPSACSYSYLLVYQFLDFAPSASLIYFP